VLALKSFSDLSFLIPFSLTLTEHFVAFRCAILKAGKSNAEFEKGEMQGLPIGERRRGRAQSSTNEECRVVSAW
jgi:hypothetical protein